LRHHLPITLRRAIRVRARTQITTGT
jgi:hypothetical protein